MAENLTTEERLARLSPAQRALLHRKMQEGKRPAIVGIGCHLPGGIRDLDGLWSCFCEGKVTLQPPTSSRILLGANPDRSAGYLRGIAAFDAGFFSVSEMEARSMEPRQRLLLTTTWEALEDADMPPSQLRGSRTGVFIGAGGESGYPGVRPYQLAGTSPHLLANRISYGFDLKGPSQVIQTACTSGLVALEAAAQSLRSGHCEMALVGAASLVLDRAHDEQLEQLGVLSLSGAYCPFDERADGFVLGEACVMLVVKLVNPQVDKYWCLLRSIAHEQSGTGNGILSPNGKAQVAAMQAALSRAGVSALEVGYVEAHGAGSPVADLLEAEAIAQVYGPSQRGQDLLCSSGKPHFGHCESAAGLVGLLRAALSLVHGLIPAQANLETVHPQVSQAWQAVPVRLADKLTPWSGQLAAVNAFAMGGSHVHLLLEGPPVPNCAPCSSSPITLLFSAPNLETLQGYSARWRSWLEEHQDHPQLRALCRRASLGRQHFAHRVALQATDGKQLLENLNQSVTCPPELQAWVAGQDIDLTAMFAGDFGGPWPTPVLPHMPLDEKDYWCATPPAPGGVKPLPQPGNVQEIALECLSSLLVPPVPDNLAHRPFAELGLDSMKLLSLNAQVSLRTGLKVPRGLIFECSSLAHWCRQLQAKEGEVVRPVQLVTGSRAWLTVVMFLTLLGLPALALIWPLDSTPPVRQESPLSPENPLIPGNAGFRSRLIRSNARILAKLGVSPGSANVFGRYNFFFERAHLLAPPFPSAGMTQAWKSKLELERGSLAQWGIPLLVVVCPSKEDVYGWFAPHGVRKPFKSAESQLVDQLAGLPVVALRDKVIEAATAQPNKNLFERTGVHWNGLGAMGGYPAIVKELQLWFPSLRVLETSEIEVVEQPEYGSDQARAAALEDRMNELNFYARPRQPDYRWQSPNFVLLARRWAAPETSTCEDSSLPTALVFRDSMGIDLMPLLSQHFRRVTYLHTGWPAAMVAEIIAREAPDVVILQSSRLLVQLPPTLKMPPPADTFATIARENSSYRVEVPAPALNGKGGWELIAEVQGKVGERLTLESGSGRQVRALTLPNQRLHFSVASCDDVRCHLDQGGQLRSVRVRPLQQSIDLEKLFAESQKVTRKASWSDPPLMLHAGAWKLDCEQPQVGLHDLGSRRDLSRTHLELKGLPLSKERQVLRLELDCPEGFDVVFSQYCHGRNLAQSWRTRAGTNVIYWRLLSASTNQGVLEFESPSLLSRPAIRSLEVRTTALDNDPCGVLTEFTHKLDGLPWGSFEDRFSEQRAPQLPLGQSPESR